MRSALAFFKKECLEGVRSGRIAVIGALFVLFGIMNPAIAKLTPWLLEAFADQLAESGMTVTAVKVDALTSWAQFFKNIPMSLITFVLLFGGIFTREYEHQALVLMLTKGLDRCKIVLCKTAYLLLLWTLGYSICVAVTYAYNAFFWDNSIVVGLAPSLLFYFVFGCLVISLVVFFSVIARSYGVVLLLSGGGVLLLYLLSLPPKLSRISPFALTDTSALLVGAESASEFLPAVGLSLALAALLVGLSIPLFNKKQL